MSVELRDRVFASNPDTIMLVIIHYYFNNRGLGLKVTPLHYRLLPHISNLDCPNF